MERKRNFNKKPQENANENPDDNQEIKNNSDIESSDENNISNIVDQLRRDDTKTYEQASREPEFYHNKNISKYISMFHQHYADRIKSESLQINMDDFIGIYGNKAVQKDRKEINKMKKKFAKAFSDRIKSLRKSGLHDKADQEVAHKRIAEIFEDIFPFLVEENNLFGPETTSILTSDYDDIFGAKIDNILEFSHGDGAYSHLGITMDLTIGDKYTINNKIEKIVRNLEKDNFIKYFQSDGIGMKGQYLNMPKVIMTGSTNTVIELMMLQKQNKDKGDDRINEHKFQFQALEEVLMQLEYFVKNIRNQKIKDKYLVSINKVKNILEEKIKNIGIDKYKEIRGTYDRGYYALKEVLEEYFDVEKYMNTNSSN